MANGNNNETLQEAWDKFTKAWRALISELEKHIKIAVAVLVLCLAFAFGFYAGRGCHDATPAGFTVGKTAVK